MAKEKASRPTKIQSSFSPTQIEQRIVIVRGQRVMLDSDLAKLYGISTMVLIQAVKHNREQLPADFAYQLNSQEFTDVISNVGRGGRRILPWVFTEHGVAMLANLLRSPSVLKTTIEIVRVFVRLRSMSAHPGELVDQFYRLVQIVERQDGQIKAISELLQRLKPSVPFEITKHQHRFLSLEGKRFANRKTTKN